MKIIKILTCILLIVLFINPSACDINSSDVQFKIIKFSQLDQNFSIVSSYLSMSTYVEKTKENRRNIAKIYNKYIFNPIWNDFASEGEYSFLAESIKSPIYDLEGLNNEIKILSISGVEDTVKAGLEKISRVLPGPNTTIYLHAIDPKYKQYLPNSYKELNPGIMAHTFGSGKILVLIDPTVSNWIKVIPKVIAHEYHHSVWTSRNFKTKNFSLIEYLIFEGRADSFAELLYPDIKVPWTNMFGSEKERSVWYEMKYFLKSRNEHVNMRMVVGDNDIPFGSAYTIGYRIMLEFLKNNPEVTLSEWTDMEAEEILLKSKYEEKFN